MNFEVTIEHFNGPLDLMLYLIKDKKLDLFECNIVELADQYIAFIHQAQDSKLEVASEYLSELAGLIEYKSKRLLPRDVSELEAKDVEDDEQNLVRRLIEYQRYKEVSLDLMERYEARLLQFEKPLSASLFKDIKADMDSTYAIDGSMYDLMNAMQRVMKRCQLMHPQDVTIERKELSIEDVIDDIRIQFRAGKIMTVDSFLMNTRSVPYLLVSFLAILDMIRLGELLLTFESEIPYLKGAL